MAAVVLALGASIAWGCSDFLAGLKTRGLAVLWVLLVSQATGLALMLVAALVSGGPLPGGHAVLLAAGAGVAELIGFAALYRALADAVLNEEVTGSQRTGVAAALAGIGLVSLA